MNWLLSRNAGLRWSGDAARQPVELLPRSERVLRMQATLCAVTDCAVMSSVRLKCHA